ncbi:MAG TPA: energy transducer TonB [Candidatus Elarobacter sp.]|nr:energy transducer TonB [Candidatus Elarobacter sp.]HEV2740675.1 energy transducer TonB [Candidatus Elarobacter sp.]
MKRNYLAYGFAISIAVHLIVLPFVRPQASVAEPEPVPTFHVDHIPTPPPTPPPTPTPRPTQPPTQPPHATPPPHAEQHPPVLIRTQHQDTHPHTGAGEPPNTHTHGDPNAAPAPPGTPGPAATDAPAAPLAAPSPTPHPTPTPLSCARPNVAPATLRAAAPDTPSMAQQQGVTGVVHVVVSLDTQNRIVGTRVQSSPSALLNQAALSAARDSQFRTEIRNCEPIAADYIFSVDFTSQ